MEKVEADCLSQLDPETTMEFDIFMIVYVG